MSVTMEDVLDKPLPWLGVVPPQRTRDREGGGTFGNKAPGFNSSGIWGKRKAVYQLGS
jgi:hypothetical protein